MKWRTVGVISELGPLCHCDQLRLLPVQVPSSRALLHQLYQTMPSSQLCCPNPHPTYQPSALLFPPLSSYPSCPFFNAPGSRLYNVHHFLLIILRALSKTRLFHKSGWNSCKLMMMPLVGHPQGGGLTILPK